MIATLLESALALHRAGEISAAREQYEAVLRADPAQPDALQLLGLIAQESGDLSLAGALIEQAIALAPGVARTHYNLGVVRALQDDLVGAIEAYESAATLAPNFAEAHSNLGNAYLQAGRREDAMRAYAAAICARPDFAAVYSNLGMVLITLERFADAIAILEAALRLAPDLPEAHANLGHAYRRTGRFHEAIAATGRALLLRPDYLDPMVNLAIAAQAVGDLELALSATLRALELGPNAFLYANLASIYHRQGRYADAIVQCDAALALRPDFAEAHVDLAVSLLVTGDFERGWDEYVWMWRLPAKRNAYPYLEEAPVWRGETFAGRRLVIRRDQGFGDAIQMARYLPMVKARGGHVAMEVAPALVPLFEDLPGLDELWVHRDIAIRADGIDFNVPLTGLPRAFRSDVQSIPAAVPYLRAPADRVERWRGRIAGPVRLRVGIAWGGNPDHENDRNRSSSLEDFAALGTLDGIAWYGLQKGRDDERRTCGGLTLDPLGAEIGDFGDTAAIIMHLDLVIAVDTAIVHLAGALAKPVWTLLAFAPDWRWLTDRADSPWYPTMRLFRQPRAGDWASVIAEVSRELAAFQPESPSAPCRATIAGAVECDRR